MRRPLPRAGLRWVRLFLALVAPLWCALGSPAPPPRAQNCGASLPPPPKASRTPHVAGGFVGVPRDDSAPRLTAGSCFPARERIWCGLSDLCERPDFGRLLYAPCVHIPETALPTSTTEPAAKRSAKKSREFRAPRPKNELQLWTRRRRLHAARATSAAEPMRPRGRDATETLQTRALAASRRQSRRRGKPPSRHARPPLVPHRLLR